jgi:hypothetical protein
MQPEVFAVSIPVEFGSATFGDLQAEVERLVGPLLERRSLKDRRLVERVSLGRRESDHFSRPREEKAPGALLFS